MQGDGALLALAAFLSTTRTAVKIQTEKRDLSVVLLILLDYLNLITRKFNRKWIPFFLKC